MRERQLGVYRAQLKLAKKHRLPVLLHVRKSADLLLKHLREVWGVTSGQALPPGLSSDASQRTPPAGSDRCSSTCDETTTSKAPFHSAGSGASGTKTRRSVDV